ncbi:MAG: hypothetical protein ABTD50_16025 [Polyangiaceae bacterium]
MVEIHRVLLERWGGADGVGVATNCDGDIDGRHIERWRPSAKRLSAGAEAGEHGLDAIEEVVAHLSVAGIDVAPGNSDT